MRRRLRVLIVRPKAAGVELIQQWVREAGYDTVACSSFGGARKQLRREPERVPDLVIADLRLGAFNGLHVALHAQWEGVPSIVIGPDDPALRKEARSLSTSYLTPDVGQPALLALVESLASMRLTRTARLEWLDESDPIAHRRPAVDRYITH